MNCDASLHGKLIADRLSDREYEEYERHLESCASCRAELEAAASEPSQWHATSQLLSSSTELRCWSRIDTSVNPPEAATATPYDLSILSPTDDPESMGRIGGYEIRGVIGRGGMGLVLKAFDRSLNRNVALKVLDPSLAGVAAARGRFALEARAMAAITHEHVVPIYAVDEHAGLPYFAMEYVSGGTLEARLTLEGTLDTLSTVRIAHQVASALAAAHQKGLVHRDIKPANILLDRGTDRVRVADFGLARVANDASHTCSGFIAGTPQYMSPEQVRGEECSTHSDQFSLGCVMYAMCVGHSPFRAETLYGVMQRIVHDTPRSIRSQNASIPVWLEQFVFRLLAKHPKRRFESAQQVAELLNDELQFLQSADRTNKPMRRWARNKRASKQLIAVVAVAGLLGVVAWAVLSAGWLTLRATSTNNGSVEVSGPSLEPSADILDSQPQDAPALPIDESLLINFPDNIVSKPFDLQERNEAAVIDSIRAAIDALNADVRRSKELDSDPWRDDVRRAEKSIRTIRTTDF